MSFSNDFEPVWQIGVYDAHCHPTDIMDGIAQIPSMRAKVLTVMSTRLQDQELVEQTADKLAVRSKSKVVLDSDHNQTSSEKTREDGEPAELNSGRMIPAFGWHPWFSHHLFDDTGTNKTCNTEEHYREVLTPSPESSFIKSLQDPVALSTFLTETEGRLRKFPFALVGEVGLDRSFRLPDGSSGLTGNTRKKTGDNEGAYTAGSREGRPLTPYKVSLEHQKIVLTAQLKLAAKHKRAVSVHSVQAHGVVFEVLQSLWKGHERLSKRQQKKRRDAPNAIPSDQQSDGADGTTPTAPITLPYPPRVCMHSFSGPAETLRMFLDPKIPSDMYISFSECINFNSPASKKAAEAIKLVPQDKILVESDLHCAGKEMDRLLESIVRRVCDIKGWELQEGAQILKRNWERFIFGDSSV